MLVPCFPTATGRIDDRRIKVEPPVSAVVVQQGGGTRDSDVFVGGTAVCAWPGVFEGIGAGKRSQHIS